MGGELVPWHDPLIMPSADPNLWLAVYNAEPGSVPSEAPPVGQSLAGRAVRDGKAAYAGDDHAGRRRHTP